MDIGPISCLELGTRIPVDAVDAHLFVAMTPMTLRVGPAKKLRKLRKVVSREPLKIRLQKLEAL